ncbi:MAG: hypothetical protein GX663_02210 [Clostridiales bacterium]|nr:hypothetical protein [Clostridiales bacterium]
MEWLQRFYMLVLNPIFIVTGRINEKHRNVVIFICMFLIMSQIFLYTTYEKYGIPFGYAKLFIVNTVLLMIAIMFSVKAPLCVVKWNKAIYMPWFIFALLVAATGIHHNVTGAFLFFAGLMVIIYPCLFFVWNNRKDYMTLFNICSESIITMTVIYFVICLVTSPYQGAEAYFGISVNPNSVGVLGVAGVISSLQLMCTEKKRLWVYCVVFGMSCTMIYLSASRASVIAGFCSFVVFAICCFRGLDKEKPEIIRKTIMFAVVIIVVLISIVGYKYVLVNVTPQISSAIVAKSVDKQLDDKMVTDVKGSSYLIDKFQKGDDVNTFSSGRITIWKEYISKLNIIGNERGNDGLYIPSSGIKMAAHNTYLEIAYRSGIFAGLLYGWIAIYSAVYTFRFLFGKKLFDIKLSLIPMAVMAFGVLSNLERAIYPVEKVHIFLFFIALAPMFVSQLKYKEKLD